MVLGLPVMLICENYCQDSQTLLDDDRKKNFFLRVLDSKFLLAAADTEQAESP